MITISLTNKMAIVTGSVIVLGLVSIPSIFFYSKYNEAQQILSNPTLAAKAEAKNLVARVGKLMILPPEDNPVVITVSDIDKLKDQPFFARGKNGDKVLIFTGAKEAILYDPDANKIVEVGPISLPTPTGGPLSNQYTLPTLTPGANVTGTPHPTVNPTGTAATLPLMISLYNGSTTVGITATAEKEIKQKYPSYAIVSEDKAKFNNYATTEVVDLTGTNQSTAKDLATLLKGETLSRLPDGEKSPATTSGQIQILAIIGNNFGK